WTHRSFPSPTPQKRGSTWTERVRDDPPLMHEASYPRPVRPAGPKCVVTRGDRIASMVDPNWKRTGSPLRGRCSLRGPNSMRPPADEAAGEGEEGFVDVVAAVGADEESPSVVQPGEGALDDPAMATEPGAVRCLAAGDHWLDATLPDKTAVLVVVVAAVGDQRP